MLGGLSKSTSKGSSWMGGEPMGGDLADGGRIMFSVLLSELEMLCRSSVWSKPMSDPDSSMVNCLPSPTSEEDKDADRDKVSSGEAELKTAVLSTWEMSEDSESLFAYLLAVCRCLTPEPMGPRAPAMNTI